MTCPSHTTARDLAEPAGLLALSSSGHYNQSPTLPLPPRPIRAPDITDTLGSVKIAPSPQQPKSFSLPGRGTRLDTQKSLARGRPSSQE